MSVVGIVVIICLTALAAQYRHHVYRGMKLEPRVSALEQARKEAFDAKDYAELKAQVQAIRIRQGIR